MWVRQEGKELREQAEHQLGADLKVRQVPGRLAKAFRILKGLAKKRLLAVSPIGNREIILRDNENKKKRLMYSVAMALLILLAVSVAFGWKRRVEQEQEKRFLAVWEVVEHQCQEAEGLAELNPLRARVLLLDAKSAIEEGLTQGEDSFSKKQFAQLKEKLEEITTTLSQVSGEYKIEEAKVFLDLDLARPDTQGDDLALHGNSLVVLDQDSQVLLKVELDKKEAETVGGGALLGGASKAGVYSGRGFVLAEAGIVEVAFAGKTSALAVERDPEWGKIVDLQVFAGNLYLLDQLKGEIFRYRGTEGGFSRRERWLGEGVFPDFSQARAMVIDGDIWVLDSQRILRFRRGAVEPFVVAGLDKPMDNPRAIDTSEESDKLYILDQGNRRVLVVYKNGEYAEQYLWQGIDKVSDMVVSEKQGKIFLLDGSVVYEIELRR